MRWRRVVVDGTGRWDVRTPMVGSGPIKRVESSYDPRSRPWWTLALTAIHDDGKVQRGVWTDTYRFNTTREPGLTHARPVVTHGELIGIAAADLAITALGRFLSEIDSTLDARSFVVNAEGRVVAHPDSAILGRDGQLPALDAIEHPAVAAAYHERSGRVLVIDGVESVTAFLEFPPEVGKPWTLGVVAPARPFLGPVRRIRIGTLLICSLILMVALLLTSRISRWISRPIIQLAEKVDRIRDFHLDNDFSAPSRIAEVEIMARALDAMQSGLDSFRRFVPQNLVKRLITSGEVADLGGEERFVTILFSDIRSYSTIVEEMPPAAVVEMLNQYLGEMTVIVEAHHGCVLEYIGDAILAVFGAPDDLADQERHAVACAVQMRARLVDLNTRWDASGLAAAWQARDIDSLTGRIGLHAGVVIAGNVGSVEHMKYGVVGDVVNVAARLEALNKELGTDILMSATVRDALPASAREETEGRGEFLLKGRQQSERVFSI